MIRMTTIIKYLEILDDLLHIYQFHSDWDTSGYKVVKHSSFKVMLFVKHKKLCEQSNGYLRQVKNEENVALD